MPEQPQTFLVTGGAGFIGSALVRLLVGQGHEVVTLDALTYAGSRGNLAGVMESCLHTFVEGSICDRALVDDLLATHRPRYLINVAAETHVDRSIDGPEAFVETNVVGTSLLLAAARAFDRGGGAAIRYVQVSTDEVYGTIDDGEFREGDPYRPNSPYAASKAAADHMVRAYVRTYGLDAVITHGSNTFGPRQFPEKLIPLMTLNAIEGKSLPVYGDGRNVRDWLYVDDHAAGIVAAALNGTRGESYNIGGGTEIENIQLVRKLCALLDRARPRPDGTSYADQIAFVEDRPGHDFRYALSSAKARDQLGWQPATAFEDGFETAVAWYIENRDWCTSITERLYARERLGQAG
jgi:dTDP-glucose 4,6-dehydratase